VYFVSTTKQISTLHLVVELLDEGVIPLFELFEQPQLLQQHQHAKVGHLEIGIQLEPLLYV